MRRLTAIIEGEIITRMNTSTTSTAHTPPTPPPAPPSPFPFPIPPDYAQVKADYRAQVTAYYAQCGVREDLREMGVRDLRRALRSAMERPLTPGEVRNVMDLTHALKIKKKPRRFSRRNRPKKEKKEKKETSARVSLRVRVQAEQAERFFRYCEAHNIKPDQLIEAFIENL